VRSTLALPTTAIKDRLAISSPLMIRARIIQDPAGEQHKLLIAKRILAPSEAGEADTEEFAALLLTGSLAVSTSSDSRKNGNQPTA
jgi:hypothetical protein